MIGTRIADRYRIDAPLGGGGMGAVYRGTDERLGKPVAIKLLLPELQGDAEAVMRFEREARATAGLTHAGIVQVLDFGSMLGAGGQGRASYLVMELAAGETLAQVLTRGPLSLADATAMGLQVLAALGAAHAAGVVHRDLKPENVMISRGADGHVHAKLLDFGLAQIKSGTAYTRLTQTGAILGTPRYMSPEQARGEACDERTDVYGTGLVLYAALAGRAPYDSDSVAGIITQVLDVMPPRLDTVNPSVPVALARAIETATQKAPAARFATTQDFAFAIDQTRVQSTPVTTPEAYALTAPPPPPVAPAVFAPVPEGDELPPLPRRGGPLGVIGTVLLLAAVGAFVVFDPLHVIHRARPPATATVRVPVSSVVPASAVAPPGSAPASEVPADAAHVPHVRAHPHASAVTPPPSTAASPTPLLPVCRMAVHCCELVGGASEACRTQPIGGADAPPGGSAEVCPLTVRSYHDVLVSQHRDASECVWPPSAARALAAPTPTHLPECTMAAHCCLRTGGTAESCGRYRDMPTADTCLQVIASYHHVLESQHEDATDCVWN